MMIEDFGPRVANVWNHLRTTTRNLVERAWQSSAAGSAQVQRATPYDPRADQEVSQLLAALDEHAGQVEQASGRDGARQARRLADACANVLSQQTQSAEIFAQLIERAHQRKDYARVDALAGLLTERLAPSEMAELGRANNVVVRALAQEALTQLPTSLLAALLRDPVDATVARQALERQVTEFASLDAQQVLNDFEMKALDEI
ncbi:MAG TPA: hypothetical protein VLN44_06305 [Pyrinomonadaceae bacterium]|nr:hypothetical protein [Pyrinomonadaceae bacterium]